MNRWRGIPVRGVAVGAAALCGLVLAVGGTGQAGAVWPGADGDRGGTRADAGTDPLPRPDPGLYAYAGPGTYTDDGVEAQVVALVNEQRARAGCPALHADPDLREAAEKQSGHMDRTDELTHVGAGGSRLWERAEAAGYAPRRIAENVAHGQRGAAAVVDAWMDSPDHRANILDCSYRDMGVARAGDASDHWWAQVLGAEKT
ncbi:CAP domain-containing protein [Streptomyces sp. Z26]|uniref:CAP domain-containing protein n=1 Tax=Streptomyces sp. Z26 TaxID=2500177 RepID=UPI000EF16F91|nr:CAP domain-containing protein [Streptomyces sp. Z26]RLL68516.1 CAP domain-containing protein [Streptomyces sp. Z26]